MIQKVIKDEKTDELVIRLPLKQVALDVLGEEIGKVPNLIGVIEGRSYSLSQSIDMSYKGKGPQEGMPLVMFENEDELRDVCKKFDIDVWIIPSCGKCGRGVRGVFTMGDLGPVCSRCEVAN